MIEGIRSDGFYLVGQVEHVGLGASIEGIVTNGFGCTSGPDGVNGGASVEGIISDVLNSRYQQRRVQR